MESGASGKLLFCGKSFHYLFPAMLVACSTGMDRERAYASVYQNRNTVTEKCSKPINVNLLAVYGAAISTRVVLCCGEGGSGCAGLIERTGA